MEGWLCPALMLHFEKAPERIYFKAEALSRAGAPRDPDRDRMSGPEMISVTDVESRLSSVWKRLRHHFLSWYKSRYLSDYECSFSEGLTGIDVSFFVERKPISLDLVLSTEEAVFVDEVLIDEKKQLKNLDYEITHSREQTEETFCINFFRPRPTKKIQLEGRHLSIHMAIRLRVKVVRDDEADLRLLRGAMSFMEFGDPELAIERLLEYEEYSDKNPLVDQMLSLMYLRKRQLREAEKYVLKALTHGEVEWGLDTYSKIQEMVPKIPAADLRAMEKESRAWALEPSYGVVVLERHEQHLLGLDSAYLSKGRVLLTIRRSDAARLLKHLAFAFSSLRDLFLHSSVRIIRQGDQVEELPRQNFKITDRREQNVSITVENEQVAYWILPDLAPGDIIEWTVHTVSRDHPVNGKPHVFILTSLHHIYFPTFRAISEFHVPKGFAVKFATRNMSSAPVPTRREMGGEEVITYESSRFIPSGRTGFRFENNYLNPIIACSVDDLEWSEVVQESLRMTSGESAAGERLPVELSTLLDSAAEKAAALERAFYWIRDNIRYASLESGQKQIGLADRAKKIVETGAGDCKDKSYLLGLVCRTLDIPYEFVVISTEHGITIGDLPSNQFNHIFLRAKPKSDWIYLDATSEPTPYGTAPAWCQGLDALVLDAVGTVITIPTDDPRQNVVEISETFHTFQNARLEGLFDLRATGHSGRIIDEQWKAISLSVEDRHQAAQQALGFVMPDSVVIESFGVCDTSSSSLFHVSGLHRRSPLVKLGDSGTLISKISWEAPPLHLRDWRMLRIDRFFSVEFPIRVDLHVTFEKVVFNALDDLSRLSRTENEICLVEEIIDRNSDSLTIHRSIVFKKKFIRGDEVKLVPKTLEKIEKALQLVMSFDESKSGALS
jgi:hypothetical protein